MFVLRYISLILILTIAVCRGVSAQEAPVTIEDAVITAISGNPNILAARRQVDAAAARVAGAQANRLPEVDIALEHTHIASPPTFEFPSPEPGVPGEIVVTSRDNTVLTFSARQAVFTGGRVQGLVTRSEALYDVALAQLSITESRIALGTREAYYGVLLSQSVIASTASSLAAAQANLEIAQARFEAGVAPQFDVSRAETQVLAAQQALVEAQNQESVSRILLNRIMGLPLDTQLNLVTPTAVITVEETIPTLLEIAEDRRPELMAARAQVAAAEAGIDIAAADWRPQVGVSANYLTAVRDDPLQPTGLTIAARASMPIFDAGRIRANVTEARALRAEAELNLQEAERGVGQDVREAYAQLQTAQVTITTAEARLRQAQEAYEIAVVRYQAGVGTAVEIADALEALAAARTNLDQAIFQRNIAFARLRAALGFTIYQ